MNGSDFNESGYESDDSLDAFEQELQGLSPRGLSDDTRQQIAKQLSDASSRPAGRPEMLTAAAVAVALSALIWFGWLAWHDVDPKNDIAEEAPHIGVEEDVDSQIVWDGIGDETVPNLWAYRKAAADGSFDDIDKLMADHSGSEMGGGSQFALADIGGQ